VPDTGRQQEEDMDALEFYAGLLFWLGLCDAPGPTANDDTVDPSRTQKPIGG
jgi:hypothetical protein